MQAQHSRRYCREASGRTRTEIVRRNLAADQFDLLWPCFGLRNRPQHKLVESLCNIFAQSLKNVVGRSINSPRKIRLRSLAHRREHRAHLLERLLS
jgi:hypothetical protein